MVQGTLKGASVGAVATRRGFLSGALSSLIPLIGGRVFAAPPGWRPQGTPTLVFGLVSDTHLRTAHNGRTRDRNYTDKYFIAALKYFREQDVDAVVHLGDFANNAQLAALQFHADAWNAVFPGDAGRDGRKVERLFTLGNHDIIGHAYGEGKLIQKFYPDPEVRAKNLIPTDVAGNWEKVWGEKYERVWHKTVKGCHFFGRHWESDGAETESMLADMAMGADVVRPEICKPFFLLSHVRPSIGFLSRFSGVGNAIALHGHNHHSAVNWNVVRFGKNPLLPVISCPACHSSRGEGYFATDSYISKAKLEGRANWDFLGRCRQGLVFRIYDDMLVISRHEFSEGGSLGPDWVMPLSECRVENEKYKIAEKGVAHPLSKEELKKKIGTPQFRDGAKLEVEKCCQCENVANSSRLRVKIPHADGNPDSRVYAYEVVVAGEEGKERLLKATYASGCNMGIGHETNGGVTFMEIPAAELPPGRELTVAVRPLSSLGTAGHPIATKTSIYQKGEKEA